MFDWLDHLTEEEIVMHLVEAHAEHAHPTQSEFPPSYPWFTEEPKPAAVLVPLLKKSGHWHVLFTRRNADLPEHSGQVSFPGGRSDDETEAPEETALREAQEEIGLEPQDVHILGRLRRYHTITNYLITPVVGVLPWPCTFKIASEEVSRVFDIPLRWLANPRNHEVRYRELPPPFPPIAVVYFKPYDQEILWGASARITLNLIDVLKKS